MSDTRPPISLVIDLKNRTTQITRTDPSRPQVLAINPTEITKVVTISAANGGFALEVHYRDGRPHDTLVFATTQEMLLALAQIYPA